MNPRRPAVSLIITLVLGSCALLTGSAAAQCPPAAFTSLGPGNGAPTDEAHDIVAWDPDGAGPLAPVLVVAGDFDSIGGVAASNIAQWTGSSWQPMGAGFNAATWCLAVYNGMLLAGGNQNASGGSSTGKVAAWNGTTWTSIGFGTGGLFFSVIYDMTVYAGELIVAGYLADAGGVPASGIARWNGSTWQALGTGVGGPPSFPGVFELEVYNGELIAAGPFTTAGGVVCNNIARWNGSSWSPLGTGLTGGGGISDLLVHEGSLFEAGSFSQAGGLPVSGVARWDGSAWHAMGQFSSPVFELGAYAGDLVALGSFLVVDGVSVFHAARWNGCWRPFGTPITGSGSMFTFDDALIAAGKFQLGPPNPGSSLVVSWRDPVFLSQPGGPGSGLVIRNSQLIPGHEYFNVASFDLCACLGSGPWGGLCFNDLWFLNYQLAFPLNSHPFHFVAASTDLVVGPYAAPIGMPIDVVTADVTNLPSVCISPVIRYAAQ